MGLAQSQCSARGSYCWMAGLVETWLLSQLLPLGGCSQHWAPLPTACPSQVLGPATLTWPQCPAAWSGLLVAWQWPRDGEEGMDGRVGEEVSCRTWGDEGRTELGVRQVGKVVPSQDWGSRRRPMWKESPGHRRLVPMTIQ